MTWHLLMLNVTVKDGERALLTRNGQLVRVLAPGKHRLFDPLHELKAETWFAANSLRIATRC
ncbi:regulator of protease activity HflC (stomatin/prohibitin superfamily) [Bradyrhizobium diazoefficiens]